MVNPLNVTPQAIINEFIYLRNWLLEDDRHHTAQTNNDDKEVHVYVHRIFTPDWMQDQFAYTLVVSGKTIFHFVDWQTAVSTLSGYVVQSWLFADSFSA